MREEYGSQLARNTEQRPNDQLSEPRQKTQQKQAKYDKARDHSEKSGQKYFDQPIQVFACAFQTLQEIMCCAMTPLVVARVPGVQLQMVHV